MDLLEAHIFPKDKSRALTGAEIDRACAEIEALGRKKGVAEAMLPQAFALVRAAPKDPRPQLLAAQLLEWSRVRENMLDHLVRAA